MKKNSEKKQEEKMNATIIRKTEFAGVGCIVQIAGVILCLTLYGAILGIPLLVVGSQMSKKWICSNCGNRLADRGVKICAVCRCQF
jgi:hypothetical protein